MRDSYGDEMISYRESVTGVTSEQLQGFFVGWSKPPLAVRNYDRQAGMA
jgi:hypothetical protein